MTDKSIHAGRYPLLFKGITGLVAATMFALLSACAGTPAKESTGEVLDDSAITAKVKTDLLKAKGVSGTDIHVETFRGNVLLSGFVRSADEKRRATDIASSVGGVKQVTNNVVVKGQ